MEGYTAYLKTLLEPLGLYDLTEHSISGGELCALGAELGTADVRLERTERESLTATAEEEGLSRREALFADAAQQRLWSSGGRPSRHCCRSEQIV